MRKASRVPLCAAGEYRVFIGYFRGDPAWLPVGSVNMK
jgi:hypothetical protein